MGSTQAHWGRHPLSPRKSRWERVKEFMREMVQGPRDDTHPAHPRPARTRSQ